jgi:hypothetical protein
LVVGILSIRYILLYLVMTIAPSSAVGVEAGPSLGPGPLLYTNRELSSQAEVSRARPKLPNVAPDSKLTDKRLGKTPADSLTGYQLQRVRPLPCMQQHQNVLIEGSQLVGGKQIVEDCFVAKSSPFDYFGNF